MGAEAKSRQILIHGIALVLAGLLWGLVVPHTTFPRLALVAHVEFTSNGMLAILLGVLLLKLPHCVGPKSLMAMLISTWLIWPMLLSEVANSWWGTNQLLSIAAAQAGAPGGEAWQENIVKAAHIIAGFGLIVTWTLMLLGFWKNRQASKGA